ncbi:MAG: response regulator [SAR324 cluster bacterium]|nr:response regulator [SAR324 cluster bacterium]
MGETILLVEDELETLESAKTMLEMLGYKVLTSSRPEEALKLVHKHKEDILLLITDIVMPKMNGWERAQKLRIIQPAMKNIFMSGYVSDTIEQQNILEENVMFLQKPFTIEKLAITIKETLG